MTEEEIRKVEDLVNEKIREQLPVTTAVMSIEEARKSGAMALFGEKYGQEVRVVSMGDFSKELCGGTHVDNTERIGFFRILSEAGISAGVRRIEALTGEGLMKHFEEEEDTLKKVALTLKTAPADVAHRVETLLQEIRTLKSENEKLKSELARSAAEAAGNELQDVKGVKLLAARVDNVQMNELRNLGDQMKEKTEGGVLVLASAADGKVSLIAMVGDEAQKKGAHAGNIIKGIAALVGGGGGGRPNMAQAGGKNPAGIDEALKKAAEVLAGQLS